MGAANTEKTADSTAAMGYGGCDGRISERERLMLADDDAERTSWMGSSGGGRMRERYPSGRKR